MLIQDAILKIREGENLTMPETESLFSQIARGEVSESEIASFLKALAEKGETSEEITGAARAMRQFVSPVHITQAPLFDTCGTGGDGKHIFNVSTVVAFVVAGAGVSVAKHGNRSVSSACGSADLLEALGVNIQAAPDVVERCVREAGIGFLFAPTLHPAMKFVQPVRQRMKMRTIFNVLGPLINPASPTHQLLGVYDKNLVGILGLTLKELGLKGAMIVWGEDGYDEVTTTGKTFVCELKDGHLKEYVLTPRQLGVKQAKLEDLVGEDVALNKQIALNILKGVEGPRRDLVVVNAGCCLYLAGSAATVREGMKIAEESIDSGHAIRKLHKLIEFTTS